RAARRGDDRRRPGQCPLAQRVPLLASRIDLRGQRRDPTQHHRPAAARPGERPLMDRDDLELFERSLRNATESHTGAALDAALVDLGWHEALAFELRAAVETLFEQQGSANVTSSALDDVLRNGLGVDAV